MRGKEGAGPLTPKRYAQVAGEFPSPCGVRRVRDKMNESSQNFLMGKVSVPLRGKEGAGPSASVDL